MSSEYDYDDDHELDLAFDDETDDSAGLHDFVGSTSVLLGSFDTDAMAQASSVAMADDTLRTQLELIEMVRQTLGPKDQLVAQICDEFESTLRTLTLEWAKFPERPLIRALRVMDDQSRTEALARLREALVTVFSVSL